MENNVEELFIRFWKAECDGCCFVMTTYESELCSVKDISLIVCSEATLMGFEPRVSRPCIHMYVQWVYVQNVEHNLCHGNKYRWAGIIINAMIKMIVYMIMNGDDSLNISSLICGYKCNIRKETRLRCFISCYIVLKHVNYYKHLYSPTGWFETMRDILRSSASSVDVC